MERGLDTSSHSEYLRSWFASNAKSDSDIKTEIGMIKTTLDILKHVAYEQTDV